MPRPVGLFNVSGIEVTDGGGGEGINQRKRNLLHQGLKKGWILDDTPAVMEECGQTAEEQKKQQEEESSSKEEEEESSEDSPEDKKDASKPMEVNVNDLRKNAFFDSKVEKEIARPERRPFLVGA